MAVFWDSEPIIEVVGTKLFCDSGYIEIYPDRSEVHFYPSASPVLNNTEDFDQWIDKTIQSLPSEYRGKIDSRWVYTIALPDENTTRRVSEAAREAMEYMPNALQSLSDGLVVAVCQYSKKYLLAVDTLRKIHYINYDTWALCESTQTEARESEGI